MLPAERLEHVRGAALARRGAVAVLRDPASGARRNERGRGRDVERRPAAARARRVDEAVAGIHLHRALAQHRCEPGDLADRLALGAERDEEGRGLRLGRVPVDDLVEDRGGRGGVEVLVAREPVDGLRERSALGIREEVAQQLLAVRGEHGLGVELDALDGELDGGADP